MEVGRRVRIEVGSLELHGVPPGRRHEVAAAFERELARLVERRGLPGGLRDADERGPSSGRLPAEASPRRLGLALARSVYESLG